ncbi:LytR C-terminal domain-containing protein [Agromyces badenianii]|uniref:LytR C-terminal domain-containing protein n=1 Tax=Agromyces badenianii TaxID=2080742 RepID=UPI000D5952B1|nr:LytR C-terminal domain-containing protein [Agromyces badenianii]PWC04934.1 hypothetical protein DCE94_00955 [Agromyces badenianii]
MAQKFPRDRFDSIPHGIDRVGAHRAPARRGAGWIVIAWGALATVVLVAAGIGGVMLFNDRLNFGNPPVASPSAEPVVTAEPVIAPDVPVLVLNGTSTAGLAAKAAETLVANGVPVGSTANASENTLTETVVYYVAPELEGAARGVAQFLPEADVRVSEQFAATGNQLVVVLGSDYADATAAG